MSTQRCEDAACGYVVTEEQFKELKGVCPRCAKQKCPHCGYYGIAWYGGNTEEFICYECGKPLYTKERKKTMLVASLRDGEYIVSTCVFQGSLIVATNQRVLSKGVGDIFEEVTLRHWEKEEEEETDGT